MKYISFTIQLIIKYSMLFLFFFIWLRYFTRKFILSIFLSLCLTVIIDLVYRYIKIKYKKNINLKIEEKEKAENIFLSLCQEYSPSNFFFETLKEKYKCTNKTRNYFIYFQENKLKSILYIDNNISPLNADRINNILKTLKRHNPNKLIICTGECDKNIYSFIKNFEIEIIILDKFDTYNTIYKEYNSFPKISYKYKKDKKLVFYDFISYSFNRARTKGYFLSALVLLFSSFFVRTNIYYCIVSSLLILFALISFFNPFFNKKKTSKII